MFVYTSKQSSTIGAKVLQIQGFPWIHESQMLRFLFCWTANEPGGCLAAKHTWISTKLSGTCTDKHG